MLKMAKYGSGELTTEKTQNFAPISPNTPSTSNSAESLTEKMSSRPAGKEIAFVRSVLYFGRQLKRPNSVRASPSTRMRRKPRRGYEGGVSMKTIADRYTVTFSRLHEVEDEQGAHHLVADDSIENHLRVYHLSTRFHIARENDPALREILKLFSDTCAEALKRIIADESVELAAISNIHIEEEYPYYADRE